MACKGGVCGRKSSPRAEQVPVGQTAYAANQPVAQPQAQTGQQGVSPEQAAINSMTPEMQGYYKEHQARTAALPQQPPPFRNENWPMGIEPGTITQARFIRDLENLKRDQPKHPGIPGREELLKNPPQGFFKPGGITTGIENTGMGAPLPQDAGLFAKAAQVAGGPGNLAAALVTMLPIMGAAGTGALGALFASSPAAAQEVAKAVSSSPDAAKALQAAGPEGSSLLSQIGKIGVTGAVIGGTALAANAADRADQEQLQKDIRAGKGGLQFPIYTPQQEEVQNQLLRQGAQQSQQFYGSNPYNFEPQAEAARRGFQQQTIPAIMERYTGLLGGRGGIRSSGLSQQLAQAGQNLESNIGALRSQYGLKAGALQQQGIGQQLATGLTPRTNTYFTPPPQGALSQFLGATAPSVSKALTKWSLGV